MYWFFVAFQGTLKPYWLQIWEQSMLGLIWILLKKRNTFVVQNSATQIYSLNLFNKTKITEMIVLYHIRQILLRPAKWSESTCVTLFRWTPHSADLPPIGRRNRRICRLRPGGNTTSSLLGSSRETNSVWATHASDVLAGLSGFCDWPHRISLMCVWSLHNVLTSLW